MKTARWFIISILILIPSRGFNQTSASTDSLKIQLMKVAREIMNSANTCALITIDNEGVPRVRTMDPFPPENDFTVWFGTNVNSRKVDQIKNNPRVNLYYLENDESGYVTIHGIAQLVDDEAEKERRWKNEWEAFYSDKSKDYLLIKITPVWMEVISYSHGIVSHNKSWEPPVVLFDSR